MGNDEGGVASSWGRMLGLTPAARVWVCRCPEKVELAEQRPNQSFLLLLLLKLRNH